MPLYEHVFLARQDLAQAQVDALAENATKILTDNGATVVKAETWGLRSLAYRIAKNRKAHYVALDVDAPPAAIAELDVDGPAGARLGERLGELRDARGAVGEAANEALRGPLGKDTAETVAQVLGRLEAALRARALVVLDRSV